MSVIHAISWADVDPDLLNSLPTKFVIAGIFRLQSVQPSYDGGFGPFVQKTPKPFLKGNQSIGTHIESDFHNEMVAFKRTEVKSCHIRMIGNSVRPPLAAAIVRANLSKMHTTEMEEAV